LLNLVYLFNNFDTCNSGLDIGGATITKAIVGKALYWITFRERKQLNELEYKMGLEMYMIMMIKLD
jgi:hypothetical protein